MFEGHDPYLVALSVVIAILGGYTGFGLAARIRGTPGVSRRVLLAGAATFLPLGIWTMHFVGMLAAAVPAGPGRYRLPRSSHRRILPDLRAGGRRFPVFPEHWRTFAASRDLLGGAAG